MKKSVPRSILVVLFLAAALAPTGCIRKAKPASPAGFIPPENLSQPTDLPFNAAWRKKDLDWHHYTEIYIAPWNTEYLRKMTWWEKIERGEKIKEDARELAAFARLTFQEAFRNDRKHRFKVVEEPGPNTLIAEFALTEVVPNRIVLNALGYAAGPVAGPAGSAAANLETATTKSTVAFEGRMKDGETKEVVALFADRESQKYSPVNVKDLTWYGHARSIIREWADQFVRMASKAPTEIIKDSPPFDLRPW
ncbi:MAG: hypothetical protein DMF55_04165 [Acidobacteria bacterium]|nr:MAG: hypothetical protein DMF55_04165 [Acidobacteriota bacterium]